MTTTLVYKRIRHSVGAFSFEQLQSTYGESYYKLYQLKLRQFLTDPQSRLEDGGRPSTVKERKDKRVSKESMSHSPEKFKSPLQNDNHGKRASSVLSTASRRTKDSMSCILGSPDLSTTESRPKSILKIRQSSSPTKNQRVISAPANSQRNLRKKTALKIPTIKIVDSDENLSKSNARSYTEVSSSTQDLMEKTNEYARQSILNTIVIHLHASTPADLSKWNLYRDFDDKFSASISPRVYRDFERIIL